MHWLIVHRFCVWSEMRRDSPGRDLAVLQAGEPVGSQMLRGKGTSESESRKRRRGTTARPPKGLETLEVRMKLVKSLLLGSAAGLFAVAGAQAADLPVKKAAPVDYVRVCSTYGTGYWFLPGTDICLRISGYMRADYLYVEPGRSDFDATGFRARGRLNFDFRQPTEYGLLRAFVRYEVTRNTGVFLGSGQSVVGTTPFFGAGGVSSVDIPLGYVQFGGFTAGRVQSFFDFWANDDIYTTLLGVSDLKTQTFAYTATFGSGWSATIAVR